MLPLYCLYGRVRKEKVLDKMDEKLSRIIAKRIIGFMVIVLLLTFVMPKEQAFIFADKKGQKEIASYIKEIEALAAIQNTQVLEVEDINSRLGEKYIKIQKKTKDMLPVSLEDKYLEHSICLTVSGLSEKIFEESCIVPTYKQKAFGENKESVVFLDNVAIIYEGTEEIGYTAYITLCFDAIYAYNVYEDENYIYIVLLEPQDIYEKIIVVDAGHGGDDTGSYAATGDLDEKDFNLDIILRLKELLDKERIKVYYTRLRDERVSLKRRVELANELGADLFVSVHCNSSEESGGNGFEILYQEGKSTGFTSKQFAEVCLKELEDATNRRNRGIVKGNRIYIVRKAKMPMVLIEAGFISNREDLNYLSERENRDNIAKGIYLGIIKSLKE